MILRPLSTADAAEALAAHAVMEREAFAFLLSDPPAPDADLAAEWPAFLARVEQERRGEDLAPGWVRATFLVGEEEGRIVGRVSVRHELTDALRRLGGHVGYCVLPEHRGRGHATALLRGGLDLLAADGVDEALVTCDDANLASATVIERCGGRLLRRVELDGVLRRHYLVPTSGHATD
jgi:predicted acetyltransferase